MRFLLGYAVVLVGFAAAAGVRSRKARLGDGLLVAYAPGMAVVLFKLLEFFAYAEYVLLALFTAWVVYAALSAGLRLFSLAPARVRVPHSPRWRRLAGIGSSRS